MTLLVIILTDDLFPEQKSELRLSVHLEYDHVRPEVAGQQAGDTTIAGKFVIKGVK
ncbi:MAG TPA: hypothetical protein VEI28_04875 [Thermodesulfovibrionales bacterium]|nr:hypothetical protein [Thermodesulfovibrionales bacterium]